MQNSLAGAARDETGGTGCCIYAGGQSSVVLDHWKKKPVVAKQCDSDLKPAIGKYQIMLTPKWISRRHSSKENRGDIISVRIGWSKKRCYFCLQSTASPGRAGSSHTAELSSMPLVDSGRQDWSVFCSYFLQDGFVAGEAKGVSA